MAIRRWIVTLAVGVAVALPLTVLAQDAPKSKTASKTHKSTDKSKGSGKSAGKTKGSAGGADDAVTDSWITMKIKTDVTNESTLKGSDITVGTKDSVVTLNGTVASEAAKTRAEQIAKQTQGVSKVIDNLTIKGK